MTNYVIRTTVSAEYDPIRFEYSLSDGSVIPAPLFEALYVEAPEPTPTVTQLDRGTPLPQPTRRPNV